MTKIRIIHYICDFNNINVSRDNIEVINVSVYLNSAGLTLIVLEAPCVNFEDRPIQECVYVCLIFCLIVCLYICVWVACWFFVYAF